MARFANIIGDSALSASLEGSHYSYALDEQGGAHILRCITHDRHVSVPDTLDGRPVTAIAHSAFAALDATETLVLPDSITQIGWSAFSGCKCLRRIVFPAHIAYTDKTWLTDCPQLTELVLPACAETIDADFLKSCHPKRLVIGSGTRSIEVPPFWTASIREVAVDAANPYLATDGSCLYSKDGRVLIRCLAESEEYRVQDGCERIADRAFAFVVRLRCIELPESVQDIGEQSFMGTALASFEAPSSLRAIGRRAFQRCADLACVRLNNGLEDIGESAFYQCDRLERLTVPASVRRLGRNQLEGTPLTSAGADPTFAIDPENPALFIEEGVLYRRSEPGGSGTVAIDAIDRNMTDCVIRRDATTIGESAFASHEHLERIVLPEGLTEIGMGAFDGCTRLRAINLPSTLRSMGTRALFNTALESLVLPAALEHLGSCALAADCTDGRVPAAREPSLRDLQIATGNERFFKESGILCERIADYARAVLYTGPQTDVVIPTSVREIGPYAFAGVKGLDRLSVHRDIGRIGTLGIAFAEPPALLELEYTDDATGAAQWLRIHPVRGQNGLRAIRNASGDGHIDVRLLVDAMDRMAPYVRDPYERMRYMLERLRDPQCLSESMRTGFTKSIRRSTAAFCVAAAQHGWHEGFDWMADLGFLSKATIDSAIAAVNAAGQIAATAYLIRMKSQRWESRNDYSL